MLEEIAYHMHYITAGDLRRLARRWKRAYGQYLLQVLEEDGGVRAGHSMRVIPTAIDGVTIVEPAVHADARGHFLVDVSRPRVRADAGLPVEFVQDNESLSRQGVLRGLHLQLRRSQGKLVRVVRGEIWDVAVDVRPDSPTFGKWVGVTLSDSNFRQLYVTPGARTASA